MSVIFNASGNVNIKVGGSIVHGDKNQTIFVTKDMPETLVFDGIEIEEEWLFIGALYTRVDPNGDSPVVYKKVDDKRVIEKYESGAFSAITVEELTPSQKRRLERSVKKARKASKKRKKREERGRDNEGLGDFHYIPDLELPKGAITGWDLVLGENIVNGDVYTIYKISGKIVRLMSEKFVYIPIE